MTQALVAQAQRIADFLKNYKFIRIISHNDADGITAAGIMSIALFRSNIAFQTTIVSHLGNDIIEKVNAQMTGDDEAVLFCDMGSGQPELVNRIKYDVCIIDHHQIVGDHERHIQINPHMAGIDGSSLISASGTAYFVACAMGNNTDLAGLALTGAIGDKQKMEGPNGEILSEAQKAGVVATRKGLRVPDGPVEEVLLTLVEPYVDTAGDKAATEKFLNELGLSGPIQNMKTDELIRLASAIALKIAARSEPSAVQFLVGDVLILNEEVVSNIYTFEWMLNCCGKIDRPGIGLALCLRDDSISSEAVRLSSSYQQTLIEQIRAAEALIKELSHIRYIALEDATGTGLIASTLIRYVCPDKPLITLNKAENNVKISARGTARLVDRGLDLAAAMREASTKVGGQGGGHNIASGASIPHGSQENFLTSVDRIIGGQLT